MRLVVYVSKSLVQEIWRTKLPISTKNGDAGRFSFERHDFTDKGVIHDSRRVGDVIGMLGEVAVMRLFP